MENKMMLTVDELSELFGISRVLAHKLAHSEGFPVLRVGTRLLIPKKQLEEWIERQTQEGRR